LRAGDDSTLDGPTFNPRASNLLELIDWSDEVYEPPLTCKLTTAKAKKFVDEPMDASFTVALSCREVCEIDYRGSRKSVYTGETQRLVLEAKKQVGCYGEE